MLAVISRYALTRGHVKDVDVLDILIALSDLVLLNLEVICIAAESSRRIRHKSKLLMRSPKSTKICDAFLELAVSGIDLDRDELLRPFSRD